MSEYPIQQNMSLTDNNFQIKLNSIPQRDKTGIYIHIPFCVRKCPYCDFYSTSDLGLKKKFVNAVLAELAMRGNRDVVADTLYFGGGTPSLLEADELAAIIDGVRTHFTLTDDVEITMEVNPGTLTQGHLNSEHGARGRFQINPLSSTDQLTRIKALGVHRLSMGVQSFNDEKLRFLNRMHSAVDAVQAIEGAISAGFHEIGIDLMYGLPGETSDLWRQDLDRALSFDLAHLSCYMLTYEPGTSLYNALQKREIEPLDDGVVSDLFKLTSHHLESNGFSHYEISNFAHLGDKADIGGNPFESRHNRKYWNMTPYAGFGPSAHSFDGTYRFWNHGDVKIYIDQLTRGLISVDARERLTKEQQMMEVVMLGLRRKRGIDIEMFEGIAGVHFDALFSEVIERVICHAWGGYDGIERDGKRGKKKYFYLNIEGWQFLDTVTSWFVHKL